MNTTPSGSNTPPAINRMRGRSVSAALVRSERAASANRRWRSAPRTAGSSAVVVVMRGLLSCRRAEIGGRQLLVDVGRLAHADDAAVRHDRRVVGHLERGAGELLDEQDGDAL